MLEFASATSFVESLSKFDYVALGRFHADWAAVIEECEHTAKTHQDCWSATVIDTNKFDAWDEKGKRYLDRGQANAQYGYCSDNTRVWKSTFTEPRVNMTWEADIVGQCCLESAISTPTLQPPGSTIPWHYDEHVYFKRVMNTAENVVRILIFVKPWCLGQFLQFGNSVISHWQAGDAVIWHPSRYHLAVNAGLENKWTCNVTGIFTSQTLTSFDFQPVGKYFYDQKT